MRRYWWVLLSVLALACGSDDDGAVDSGADAGDAIDAGGGGDSGAGPADAGSDGGGASDAGDEDGGADAGALDGGSISGCPPLASRTVVDVPGGVLASGSTHWTCDNVYVLSGTVLVHSSDPSTPQVLRIDPGTVVRGSSDAATRGFLVVTRSGRIEAEGTVEDPIVFTSNAPLGTRARDDWGGITLLGRATRGGTRATEGFPTPAADPTLAPFLEYGPIAPESADDSWSCGTLRYVRVEFASFNAGGAGGNESNAVQIYSCGWDTEIDYLQTHLSGDDGVEIFGGTVDLRHLVLTGASDDGFDYDDGWSGRAQFVVVQQHADVADFGIEAGGSSDTPPLPPRARLFNFTLVGSNGAAGQIGARWRGASEGTIRNFVFLGFVDGFFDIGGSAAAANLQGETPALSIRNAVLWRASAATGWPTGSDDAGDGDLDEGAFFTMAAQANAEVDPMLGDPFDLTAPDFVPAAGAPLGARAAEAPSESPAHASRPAFFDTTAGYVGAFAPGGTDWTAGWTAYPES